MNPQNDKKSEQNISFGERKRRYLFDLFSRNLDLTKKSLINKVPGLRFEPEIDNGYVCPLCFRLFPVDAISDSYDNPLTLEHVPPGILRGEERLLTCRQCNNTSGSKLESQLKQKLHDQEFVDGIPNSGIDVRFRIDNKINLAATLYHSGQNTFKIIYDPSPKRSHPEHVESWREVRAKVKATGKMPGFTLEVWDRYQPRRSEIAWLRIAYLLAFCKFGYQFLFLPNLGRIRHQIMEPTEQVLPALGASSKTVFPDEALGINVICEPEELQSLLVVFDVTTQNRTTRHGVILPGPTQPGLDVYTWLAKNKALPTNIKFRPVPENNYLECLDDFDYLKLWKELKSP